MIPKAYTADVIDHVCMVHSSVGDYSKLFLQKLRRSNYVTPKNYLDFISTYSKLLEENDQYILGERMEYVKQFVPHVHVCDHLRHFYFVNFFSPFLAQCKHLEGGLDKLKEASVQLAELNIKLAEQKVVLAEKSIACETLLNEIVTNTTIGQ